MNKDTKKFWELARKAVKFYREKEWGASIAVWDEIISLLQDDSITASVYTRRGNAKDEKGDHEDAIADHDRAIEISPQYAMAYNNRGIAKRNMGDYKDAIADHDRAIEINPQYAKAYSSRGITKRNMGDYKDAIADHDRAIEISPQYAMAYNNRGVTKRKMGDYKDAIADYDRAIEINPQYAKAYKNRGFAKDSLGDYKDAIADYDQALKIDPYHKSALALSMQASQKEREELRKKYRTRAKEEFDRALQASNYLIDPTEYEEAQVKYEEDAQKRGKWVWGLSFVLAVLAAFFYGLIADFGIKEWQAAQSPMAMRSFSPLSLFPFVFMVTLALSPLAWVIRMLNRDKHKYWVLREDAAATRKMVLIIQAGHRKREDLWLQLFDHHDKRGGAHLIADWKHSDTSGGDNNFTIKPGGGD